MGLIKKLRALLLMPLGVVFFCAGLTDAEALPLFSRQTGQNCVSCHAGGQYPELTPYGRYFKLTAYTIGDIVLALKQVGLLTV